MKLHEYKKKYSKNKDFAEELKKIEAGKNLEYNISQLVTEARRYSGITQKQLAKMIKTKQPAIARIENGSRLPNISFLQKIADAIGTTLDIKWGFMVNAEINNKNTEENHSISKSSPSPYITGVVSSLTQNSIKNTVLVS